MGQYFMTCCDKEKRKEIEPKILEKRHLINDYRLSVRSTLELEPTIIENIDEFKVKSSNFVRRRSCCLTDIYEELEIIGEGSYGRIVKVRHIITNDIRVMKIINKGKIEKGVSEHDIITEINILKSMDHPNIIKVFEFFMDDINIYVIKEYFKEGDLFNNLAKLTMNETLICSIMKQIFSAISYLHSKQVLHGDIKLENILIDTIKGNYVDIKITDFGCSKIFHSNRICRKVIGTTYYLAPEVILSQYNEKCDIWAAGVILFILFTGNVPFNGITEKEITEKIKNNTKLCYDLPEFENVSKVGINLLKSLLSFDYNERPSAAQVLKDPWFDISTHTEEELIEKAELTIILNNLRHFHSEKKFQRAVITFLTHNMGRNDEVNNLRNIFKILDKDLDGKISILDLKKGLEEHFGNIALIEVEEIMRNITLDHNTFIEYEDFLGVTLDKNKLFSDGNLKEAFDLFDVKKDGKIHAKFIKNVISKEHEVSDEAIKEILNEIEVNIDDDIDYNGFKKLMYTVIESR